MINALKNSLRKPMLRNVLVSALVLFVFLAVTLSLTYQVITLPSLVIGDNFNWTPSNVLDILGPKIIRESYMGDIAVVSTFKTGFLFPLTYLVTSLNLPSTLVYPALFYFLSMLSFYFLSKEFLSSKVLCIVVSILYVVNPVTPYYFASILNAFSLAILPLALKFFVKTLKVTNSGSPKRIVMNFVYCMFFMALAVSANEQFILSAFLLSVFMVGSLTAVLLKNYGLSLKAIKPLLISLSLSAVVFLVVNLPLLLSLGNVQSAPWSTYFQGPDTSHFISMIDYTYRPADLSTVLRLGGDSGTGLGQASWYDSPLITNLFGYALFGIFIASIVILVLKKDRHPANRAVFYTSISLLFLAVFLIFIIKSIPSYTVLQQSWFDNFIKTWENPAKLRVIVLLSLLVSSFVAFNKLELFAQKKKLFGGLIILLMVGCMMVYNSPWAINYAGQTPMTEIAEAANWGSVYNQEYAAISNSLQQEPGSRSIILPYTHEVELYSPPNARIFQIVSQVTPKVAEFTPPNDARWSKALGMLSIKAVAVKDSYNPSEMLIFPSHLDGNQTLTNLKSDKGFSIQGQMGNYNVLENKNCLPITYASNYYVFYDDMQTLGYAFDAVDFANLPVFIEGASGNGGLTIPTYVAADNYTIYAVGLTSKQEASTQSLNIVDLRSEKTVVLQKDSNSNNPSFYTATQQLNPADILAVNGSQGSTQTFPDLTLNSSSTSLGNFGSFILNFNVRMLVNGNYSFLGPRVVLDTGSSQYYIIFHDNGFVELAVMQNGVFHSAVMTQFVGYNLLDTQNSLEVRVERIFDKVSVYVEGKHVLDFSTESKFADINLTSEQSISAYSNIIVRSETSFRLFAIRQSPANISYSLHSSSTEEIALTAKTASSDFAVVSQYLYTNLTHIQNSLPNTEVQANVLYKAWLINQTNPTSGETTISIGTQNLALTLSALGLAVVFSYLMLLQLISPIKARVLAILKKNKIKKNI